MQTILIERLKKGDYFKFVSYEFSQGFKFTNNVVYVYDGYDRFNKKYSYHRFDNTSIFGHKKKGALVSTDFEF